MLRLPVLLCEGGSWSERVALKLEASRLLDLFAREQSQWQRARGSKRVRVRELLTGLVHRAEPVRLRLKAASSNNAARAEWLHPARSTGHLSLPSVLFRPQPVWRPTRPPSFLAGWRPLRCEPPICAGPACLLAKSQCQRLHRRPPGEL